MMRRIVRSGKLGVGAQVAAVLLVLLVAWEVLGRVGLLDVRLFSSPSRLVEAYGTLAERDRIWPHVLTTLNELAMAFVLFTIVAGILGFALGASQKAFDVTYGPIATLFALPKVTLAPIFILLFGFGYTQKVLFGAMFGFFPLIMNTMVGVRAVRSLHLDLFRSVGAGPLFKLWRLYLPATLPQFLTGLRIGFVYAGIGVLLAEMFVATRGLGNRITAAVHQTTLDAFWVYVGLAAAMLLVGAGAIRLLELRFDRWREVRA